MKLAHIFATLDQFKLPEDADDDALEAAFTAMLSLVAENGPVRGQLPLLETYPDWRGRLLSAFLALDTKESSYASKVMKALLDSIPAASHEGVVL